MTRRIKISPETFKLLADKALAPFTRDAVDEYKRTGEIIVDDEVFRHLNKLRQLGESTDDLIRRTFGEGYLQ